MICEYGCGREAKYKIKRGKWCCEIKHHKCPNIRKKNSLALKKAHLDGKFPDNTFGDSVAWRKGLTEFTDDRIKNNSDALREFYKHNKSHWLGKHHTDKTKELLSKKTIGSINGYVKTKYYSIWCPYLNHDVKVQGTYELKYATFLNEHNILWTRDKKLNLRYRMHTDTYTHTYYPDFYLIDTNEYVETKGLWYKSKDGLKDDRIKMQCVIACNGDKKIKILEKNDLKKLGIKI